MCMSIGNPKRMRKVSKDKPLIAWRHFNLDRDGSLDSTGVGYTWKPGVNVERGKIGLKANQRLTGDGWINSHRASNRGFWAHKSKQYGCGGNEILAKVALWGTVAEHARGYRAQYARVLLLVAPRTPLELAVERYKVILV